MRQLSRKTEMRVLDTRSGRQKVLDIKETEMSLTTRSGRSGRPKVLDIEETEMSLAAARVSPENPFICVQLGAVMN